MSMRGGRLKAELLLAMCASVSHGHVSSCLSLLQASGPRSSAVLFTCDLSSTCMSLLYSTVRLYTVCCTVRHLGNLDSKQRELPGFGRRNMCAFATTRSSQLSSSFLPSSPSHQTTLLHRPRWTFSQHPVDRGP